MSVTRNRSAAAVLVLAILLAGCVGCSPYTDPDVPEPIRPFVEPEHGGKYLLYRPSDYDRERAWPLVVLCHSAFPDSPIRQLRTWTRLAEEKGFLVLVPRLRGTKNPLKASADKQIPLQRVDERHILACMRHVRAGHNVSDDRVLIHGFGGGAFAALHTGLKHPDLFRAMALTQPKFNSGFLAEADDDLDPFQPVYVDYDVGDAITGKHAARCVAWLRSKNANLTEDSAGPSRRFRLDVEANRRAIAFFERILREQPLIRIRAFPACEDGSLEIQFKLRCSFTPGSYSWDFGDGGQSPVAAPTHTYAKPGSYRVTVTVKGPNGNNHTRTQTVRVEKASG